MHAQVISNMVLESDSKTQVIGETEGVKLIVVLINDTRCSFQKPPCLCDTDMHLKTTKGSKF